MTLASNMNNVLTELHAVLLNSDLADMADKPENTEREAALSMTLGKRGHRPPWPRMAGEAAAWQTRQIQELLRQAEVLVISPAAHAAVMAAAATLEPADISTLHRDRDVLMPTGLLVLPEPIVVVNRTGSLSDTRAFGWQFITQHQILPTARYPGVLVTTFMDRDGPVQPAGWRQAVSQARASGNSLPPLMPDGMYGMRGDACLAEESNWPTTTLSHTSSARSLRRPPTLPGRPALDEPHRPGRPPQRTRAFSAGSRYRPTTSRTLSMNSRSMDSLKGEEVTSADVHDAWAAWMKATIRITPRSCRSMNSPRPPSAMTCPISRPSMPLPGLPTTGPLRHLRDDDEATVADAGDDRFMRMDGDRVHSAGNGEPSEDATGRAFPEDQ